MKLWPVSKGSVQPLPLLVLLLPLTVLITYCGSDSSEYRRVEATLNKPLQPVITEPFALKASDSRGTRLNFYYDLPQDTSLSLSAELLDSNDKVLLHFDQEGWRETGTWYEEGYSGTYDQSDTYFWVQFKPKLTGDYRLKLQSDYFLGKDGQPVVASVPVLIQIGGMPLDQSVLLATLVVSGILAFLFLSLSYSSRPRWQTRSGDIDSASRQSRMDYDAGLICLEVDGAYDYGSQGKWTLFQTNTYDITMQIRVIDALGYTRNESQVEGQIVWKNEEDEPSYFALKLPLVYFQLDKPANLRFSISLPDYVHEKYFIEQDYVTIKLSDRCIVPWGVDPLLIV
ncbi:MAG: hypothetical protein CL862_03595 [Cyanobium sp. NAT70]|nr:hypothetical protein [Cyanobium sp. NAT70]|tara:strand:+ start:231 stop:1253 length:1023 start_codon:yes stop_codon:yes gene_type:complete